MNLEAASQSEEEWIAHRKLLRAAKSGVFKNVSNPSAVSGRSPKSNTESVLCIRAVNMNVSSACFQVLELRNKDAHNQAEMRQIEPDTWSSGTRQTMKLIAI